MNTQELESQVNSLQEQVKSLSGQLQRFKDIEEIKKLQRAYGYYLDNFMTDEIVDLFADRPDTILRLAAGEFHGIAGVKRFFKPRTENKGVRKNPDFLHQVMQLSPIVDVAPDGLTARGRWYGFGPVTEPVGEKVFQGWENGIYENDYIKEDGVWKIWKVRWWMYFFAHYNRGFVAPEKQTEPSYQSRPPKVPFDKPAFETFYPTKWICPFHYPHPVTGKPVVVDEQRPYYD